MVVLDGVAAQDENRDVDHGEHAQEQERRRVAQALDLARGDQTDREQRHEDDADHGCAARGRTRAMPRGRMRSLAMP